MHFSSGTHFSILVIFSLATGKVPHSSVYEDISRASVEIICFVDPTILFGRHKRTVSDPAYVLADSGQGGMYEGEGILKTRQRRPLSTNLLFRGSEIIYCGFPRPIGTLTFSCRTLRMKNLF